ncbi:glycosyltransferase family protein [Pokkaliibacter sp. CJK22405]|uniref:glycosyltransferase family protein n=1 Tax=Pokkaliibacter sp. CJK22405 TaxID=3384615 RepID=UPI003984E849
MNALAEEVEDLRLNDARVLIYSHDTFGLGHLRRCRALAHALVDRFKGLSVLILTGSPIIGRFDFKARVDFVRIPGVIKLYNGDYTSLGLHIELGQTLALRESIILNTARAFDPDLFIVDKEPLGLKGEVESTLQMLKDTRCKTVLGIRDVMDEPVKLTEEWHHKKAFPALENLYDEIWVYGDRAMGNPLEGLPISGQVLNKMSYTGYLERQVPEYSQSRYLDRVERPYLLVTPGGGGDGASMVDWVLRAYEQDPRLPWDVMIVLGPFMSRQEQQGFIERAEPLSGVHVITFDSNLESLMNESAGIVAMGGYNTFCEILSFNKPSLLIPRTEPRLEQFIRATNATSLGLATMLDPREEQTTGRMIEALYALAEQPSPQSRMSEDMLSGLTRVQDRVEGLLLHAAETSAS